jgi:hypothetical protein
MKKLLFPLFFLLCAARLFAANEVNSVYQGDGVFTSEYKVVVNAPILEVEKMIDRLIKEATETPETLDEWALVGIGQRGDGSDNVILGCNDVYFNPKTGQFIAYLNVDLVGIKKMENIPFECLLERAVPSNATKNVAKLIVFYTNFVLKEAWGSLTTERIDDQSCILRCNARIKFGWFFNLFFTTHKYKENVDWRIKQFVGNLKKEVEK